jgi:glycosyltransferase involved in cell wall biosynthesis
MRRVCVQWPRFGPYHLARLRAAHDYFAERDVEVIGLETAGDDATYAWEVERGAEPFRRVQVFPNRTFESISPRDMEAGLTDALDALDPDGVGIVSYSHPDARACLAWCRQHRRTAVLMSTSKADDGPRTAWREWVKTRLVSQYDAALVGGTAHRDYLGQLGFPVERTFFAYNAVDNAYFWEHAEAARMLLQGEGPAAFAGLPGLEAVAGQPFFLACNRFLAIKNLDGLLRAYAEYRRLTSEVGYAPWPLLLLGDGPERPALEAIVREHGIAGVAFCGFRQKSELPYYYGLAGALIHPTLKDTWGLVVNEAMAAGLPVLVSERAGCAHDLVRDGENGHTFDPTDAAAMTRLMAWVSAPDTDWAKLGACSREIVRGWAPEAFAEGLWNAFQAGARHADRGLGTLAAGVLHVLRAAARDVRAFHSVAD